MKESINEKKKKWLSPGLIKIEIFFKELIMYVMIFAVET